LSGKLLNYGLEFALETIELEKEAVKRFIVTMSGTSYCEARY
jgi:hypothetical protein